IDGTWNITVLDGNGYVDNVVLHQGTIINPTGLTLAPGMNVTILGNPNGDEFDANEIDTPYHYSAALPTPVYYGPGWWYPGFAYGYGPSFSLIIGGGGYIVRQPWGGHWWASAPVRPFVGVGVNVNVGGGYRYPEYRGGYAGHPAVVPVPAQRYAPRYSAPVAPTQAYRYPAARSYAPATRTYAAPRYSAPAARSYGGGYAAPRSTSSAPRYSAPAARSYGGGGASYRGSASAHYSTSSRGDTRH
ncbi:MAG: hypothetical protein JOY98_10430, partial [Candidatus Eremiobacteraeota bacterium]|nr:hypothetical protein [Candidatus Eremiobacteraeota bacterium]